MAKLKYIKNGQINEFGFSNGGSSASIDDNTTSKDKTWSSDKISQNLNNIANEDLVIGEDGKLYIKQADGTKKGTGVELPSSGEITQEQIDNAVTTYLNANPISGGMTTTAKNLLITILRNALYNTNQSANITALESALASSESGGGDTPVVTNYNITNNLTNCANSNVNTSVAENSSYVANITASDGYILDSVIIIMGGEDITSSVYSDGQINISSVTGDIVITASASETSSEPQPVTDGLVDYFDFRNCSYNNSGSGGTTLISSSQGNGQLYTWSSDKVAEQGNYGMKISRVFEYSSEGGTTTTNCGTSFTWIFKCYLTSVSTPFFNNNYAGGTNLEKMNYYPKYNTSSGTANVATKGLGTRITGYDTVSLIIDENTCKLYFDNQLIDTVDGSTIDDFVSWYDKLSCSIIGGNDKGYITQLAIYNKALSEVELVDMLDYLKSLEVAE